MISYEYLVSRDGIAGRSQGRKAEWTSVWRSKIFSHSGIFTPCYGRGVRKCLMSADRKRHFMMQATCVSPAT